MGGARPGASVEPKAFRAALRKSKYLPNHPRRRRRCRHADICSSKGAEHIRHGLDRGRRRDRRVGHTRGTDAAARRSRDKFRTSDQRNGSATRSKRRRCSGQWPVRPRHRARAHRRNRSYSSAHMRSRARNRNSPEPIAVKLPPRPRRQRCLPLRPQAIPSRRDASPHHATHRRANPMAPPPPELLSQGRYRP
jgi:hypothetical protein